MKEELISFETAKLAKEKGFLQTIWDYNVCDGFGNIHTIAYFNSSHPDKEWYALIPQSLLQRWLREEHGIHIEVYISDACNFASGLYSFTSGIVSPIRLNSIEKFETYESALEYGLQEALKLIKG